MWEVAASTSGYRCNALMLCMLCLLCSALMQTPLSSSVANPSPSFLLAHASSGASLLSSSSCASYTTPNGAPKFNGTVFFKITPSTGRTSEVRDSADVWRLSGWLLSSATPSAHACCWAILLSSSSSALSKMVSRLPSPGLGARVSGPVSPMSCCGVVDWLSLLSGCGSVSASSLGSCSTINS